MKYRPLIRLVPHETKYDFVKFAPFAAVLSALAIAASIFSFATTGLNLGVYFKGGTLIEIVTPGPAPLAQLRSSLGAMGAHDAQVQGFGSPQSAMLRFKPEEGKDALQAVDSVKRQLADKFPGIQFKRVEVVGPKASGELLQSGFLALGVALLLMLGYIWFRFQLQFGFGAVLAVFHDIFLTLGLLSVMQIEFSMTSIAALLTVIGYSMNEKVITFDRLRENLRKYKKTPLRDVINLSENERLSRTLITGTTALLALSGTLFLGGAALFPLVFTMTFGILIGTYSSIYVALPVILLWGVNRDDGEATPLKPANAAALDAMRQPPSIDAYGAGGFRVSGERREGSLLILNDAAQAWSAKAVADLRPDDFAAAIAAGPSVVEFVLLGTGAAAALPPKPVREALRAAGMGLEFMSTEAAARMYNVLASEGRRMAAALVAI